MDTRYTRLAVAVCSFGFYFPLFKCYFAEAMGGTGAANLSHHSTAVGDDQSHLRFFPQ